MVRIPLASCCAITLTGCGRINFEPVGSDADSSANLVFVTASPYTGAFGSLEAADAVCAAHATSAGLHGTFRALLSGSTITAIERLAGARGWTFVDGRPVLDEASDLIGGKLFHPIMIDERGALLADLTLGWTGSGPDGNADSHCLDYTSTQDLANIAEVRGTGSAFLRIAKMPCSATAHLFCFAIDKDVAVIPATPGRRMFLSDTSWTPTTGIASADAVCAGDAAAAGLTGTFRAWLATTTTSASSRFSAAGPTWVRVDGVALAPTAADVLAGTVQTTLSVTAQRDYRGGLAFTGATSPTVPGTTNTTCADWSSAAATGTVGGPGVFGPYLFNDANQSCGATARLYCLEP